LKPKRSVRLAEEILKELDLILMEKIGDPRLRSVTFTQVVMTDDLKTAKVYYSVLGEVEKKKEAQVGLAAAKGFIKREIAMRMSLRYVPELLFFYDESIEVGSKIERILQKIDDGRKQES